MTSIKEIQNEQKTHLLANIINNWLKENNNIYNSKKKIKFQNVSDWPKRSPFEFYNKNLIIPNNYISLNDLKNDKSPNQKLKIINDNVNQIISKKRSENNENNNQNESIKISIISPNKKAQAGSVTIKQISNEQKEENKKIETNKITQQIKKEKNDNKEKEIMESFGYNKEEKIKSLKLSLNKRPLYPNEKEYLTVDNLLNNENNKTLKQIDENINIEQNKVQENIIRNEDIKKEPKMLILPKSEKEIAYYKEKDLFDEEIKVNDVDDFTISQEQMNIINIGLNKIYKGYRKISKRNKFKIFHPYCEYDYHHFDAKEKSIANVIDYNNKKQEKLYDMLKKQKQIINNIFIKRKNNILSKNNLNNNKDKLSKNISSIYENKLNRLRENYIKNKKCFRSYSTSDYYNEINWEKRQQMLEKQKDYSIVVLYNKRKNLEARKNAMLIKKILLDKQIQKEWEESKKDFLMDEEGYEDDNVNNDILPEIKSRNNNKEESIKVFNYIIKNKAFSHNTLNKYALKKNEQEKIINTMIKHNPKLEQLLYKYNI